jgi:O-glycosyl hydrolase
MLRSTNIISERSGKPVVNQIVTEIGDFVMFHSYGTLIAVYNKKLNKCFRNVKYVKFSRTTEKYFNIFVTRYVNPKEIVIYKQGNFQSLSNVLQYRISGGE